MSDGNQRLDLNADTVPDNAADLTLFVQNLLEQMQGRFNTMSTTIISRIDEMGGRIDDLEKSIGELMQQAGVDASAEGGDESGKK
jgi:heat shock factor-binding protein 1